MTDTASRARERSDFTLMLVTRDPGIARFVDAVAGRARTCILLETAAAYVRVDRIAATPGLDEIHIGLNDLHISMGLAFMYESLAGGVLDHVISRIRAVAPGIRYGF